MSTLTSDLDNPVHPVTIWLTQTFPYRDQWVGGLLARVMAARPIALNPPTPVLFGRAFEYAIGLDLATADPYPQLLEAIPPRHAAWLLTAAGYMPEAGTERWLRRTSASGRRKRSVQVHAAAWYLAYLQDVLHTIGGKDPQRCRQVVETVMADVSVPRGAFTAAAPTMLAFWRGHLASTHEPLQRLGLVTTGPVVYPGYATADLIAGTTLVEIKTGWIDEENIRKTLNQIISYALLAGPAGHAVTSIAVHLARYRLLIHDPLQTLANELAGKPVDIGAAAGNFATVVSASRPHGYGNK